MWKLCNPAGKNRQLLPLDPPSFFLKFQLYVLTAFWKTASFFSTLWHCLSVSLCHWYLLLWNWLGIWLAAHLFICTPSYISQLLQRSSPPPRSTLWPTFAIQVCWQPIRSNKDPLPSSTLLTGDLIYAGSSSSPAASKSYWGGFVPDVLTNVWHCTGAVLKGLSTDLRDGLAPSSLWLSGGCFLNCEKITVMIPSWLSELRVWVMDVLRRSGQLMRRWCLLYSKRNLFSSVGKVFQADAHLRLPPTKLADFQLTSNKCAAGNEFELVVTCKTAQSSVAEDDKFEQKGYRTANWEWVTLKTR